MRLEREGRSFVPVKVELQVPRPTKKKEMWLVVHPRALAKSIAKAERNGEKAEALVSATRFSRPCTVIPDVAKPALGA